MTRRKVSPQTTVNYGNIVVFFYNKKPYIGSIISHPHNGVCVIQDMFSIKNSVIIDWFEPEHSMALSYINITKDISGTIKDKSLLSDYGKAVASHINKGTTEDISERSE